MITVLYFPGVWSVAQALAGPVALGLLVAVLAAAAFAGLVAGRH